VNVGNLLARVVSSSNTRDFTLEKGLMSVVNVGNYLPAVPVFSNTRELIVV
jgi:hypothetical protein